ncbi:MAG: hypothetical protein M3N34_05960 [Pseudomonadota bacterium]|nr:hypothetical protein [Pseudomonadota bacterium]
MIDRLKPALRQLFDLMHNRFALKVAGGGGHQIKNAPEYPIRWMGQVRSQATSMAATMTCQDELSSMAIGRTSQLRH